MARMKEAEIHRIETGCRTTVTLSDGSRATVESKGSWWFYLGSPAQQRASEEPHYLVTIRSNVLDAEGLMVGTALHTYRIEAHEGAPTITYIENLHHKGESK